MKYKVINDINDMIRIEELRKEITKVKSSEASYYYNQLLNGAIIPIGVLDNDELIGGIYVSCFYESLFIEYIFVKENYRRKGIATNLMKYVIDNKSLFKKDYTISRLEPSSKESEAFAKTLGYSKPNSLNIMKKRI